MTAHDLSVYSTILAAVPIRVAGHPALSRAINVATRSQGAVTLIHVLEQADEKTEPARRYVEQLMSSQPLVRDMRLVAGRTWSAINEIADSIKANLIVLGSHVHGQLRALLGSRSDRILHHANRDVLVVRSEIYTEHLPPKDYTHVLAAIDVNRPSQWIADRAVAVAQTYCAKLTLLHVLEHYPVNRENQYITPEDRDPVQYQRAIKAEILANMTMAAGYSETAQDVVVTNETARRPIPAYAQKHEVDLIIIGAHGDYGVDVLFGATADAVVHRAPCDVLVVYRPIDRI